ncbi:MAG: adenine deaminase [Spirochaetia bacterium]
MTKNERLTLVDAAAGRTSCDLCIANAKIVNVFTKEILEGTLYITSGYIVDVDYTGNSSCIADHTLDAKGQYLSPGFIDTHLHIESSMLTPRNFVSTVLPFGTTTLVTDPHELANVLGTEGVRYVIESSEDLPINYYILIPSCVPSVEHKENAGAAFYAQDIAALLDEARVLGIGEIMDYMGVVNNHDRMVDIIDAGYQKGVFLQGHLPSGQGNMLSAYLCGGPVSCHESWQCDEALEKLRKGMWVDARESSLIKNVKTIVDSLPDKAHPPINLSFCTDDKEADDILKIGHMNDVVRTAIQAGMPPVAAISCATLHAALEVGLKHHGAIAPGYYADLFLTTDLQEMMPSCVLYRGKIVAKEGQLHVDIPEKSLPIEKRNTIVIGDLDEKNFDISTKKTGTATVNIMSFENEISLIAHKKQDILPIENGRISLSSHPQYNYTAVINRYVGNDNIALGITENFHINAGAIAASVGHDCHNITIVYNEAKDALVCARRLKELGGGCVAAKNGKVVAELALPIAGLISPLPATELAQKIHTYNMVLKEEFGIKHPSAVLRSFFIALAVIPYVKMTDMGLIDVLTQEFIPVIEP